MSNKAHPDTPNPKGFLRIWPFLHPISRIDALTFLLAILATVVGFIAGLLEASWAFAAISFLLGITVFQEYWTRVARLAQMEDKLNNVHRTMVQLPVDKLVAEGLQIALEKLSPIIVYDSREEVYTDLAKRLSDVKKPIQIIEYHPSWPPTLPNHDYHAKLDTVSQQLKHYHAARIVSPTHWQAIKNMLEHWKDNQVHIACFFDDTANMLPIIPCIILDESEAYFGLEFLGFKVHILTVFKLQRKRSKTNLHFTFGLCGTVPL